MDTQHIIDVAAKMADAARSVVLSAFRSAHLSTDNKDAGGFDPVTDADRAAERVMRDILRRERPDDAILGEEYGAQSGRSGLTWVIDPIDGTRSFISGVPLWGVLIAVVDATGPIYGVIDQPYIGERFQGGFGQAKLHGPNGQCGLKTRPDRSLSQSIMLSTYPEMPSMAETQAFDRVRQQVQLTRFGTDCYGYALLAAGHVDLVIEAGLQSYDVCAPIALIEAAGGIVTNWQGGPAHQGGQIIAAASRQQHEAALELLNAG